MQSLTVLSSTIVLLVLVQYCVANICTSVYPRASEFRLTNFTKTPFYLIQSDNFYNDDQPVLVEIGGSSFRGFLLAAVDPLTGRRIGSFIETQGIFTLPCSAAIHSDYHLKKHALLMWRPPRNSKGFVAFEITLMDELGRFLVGQISILPHQLFTHLQMIPVYSRITTSQHSSSTFSSTSIPELSEQSTLSTSLGSSSSLQSPFFPSLSSSFSNNPQTSPEIGIRENGDNFYRFVPILVPTLSQQRLSSPGNNEIDAGQSFYLSSESSLHPRTVAINGQIKSSSQPCPEKSSFQQHHQIMQTSASSPEESTISIPQHNNINSQSSLSSSASQQSLSSSMDASSNGRIGTPTKSVSNPGLDFSTVSSLGQAYHHHHHQPLNQLLGKLLHSISTNGQQKK